MSWHFIEPVDVLFLRGNRPFGEPGSYGESQVPPWPSVAAGAIRSSLLARDGIDFRRFRSNEQAHPDVGTPEEPGPFRLTAFGLAQRVNGQMERLYTIPADLSVSEGEGDEWTVTRTAPESVAHGIQSSYPLARLPVLAQRARSKPVVGCWLRQTGWEKYLRGETPNANDLSDADRLWRVDERVGVGLDPALRRAADGKLFSAQGIAFDDDVGFVVEVRGARLPDDDLLRFGGDGRGARMQVAEYTPPSVDPDSIVRAGRCRIVLTTPGLFPDGWRLPGMAENGHFELNDVKGRVIAAAVPRAETVSGWDLARWQPKAAQRVVPTGSVYWIDDLEATGDALCELADHGLWSPEACDRQRRAEGFNRFEFAID